MVRSFFRLGLGMGFSELEFIGQIASFERRLRGGGLQRPSPCLIRAAPRRERGQTLSEASEKCDFFLYFGRYTPELFLDRGTCRA